ncbi:MAG: hypothetical protein SXU28_14375 [Pseudomonadota bacterium]|nr:hypothetical protein [Pseudomonadota bacterium]
MKLDMTLAWDQTTSLIKANLATILTVAGLFIFVPYLGFAMLFPEAANFQAPEPPPGAPFDQIMNATMEALQAQYAKFWVPMLIATLIQMAGSLALLALLGQKANPTVGESIKRGAFSIPTYIVSQILTALFAGVVIGLPIGLAGAISPVLAGLLILLAIPAMIYLVIKLSLVTPVIAIEGTLNPITALQRSWRLTKGNSMRLAIFLILLFIVVGVIGLIVSMVFTTAFAAIGGTVQSIGIAFVEAAVATVSGALFAAVYVAVYNQLNGASPESVADTFE